MISNLIFLRKKLLEELKAQERIEGIMEINQKRTEVKLEEETLYEEAKMNIIKKINFGSFLVSNQYETPTKEKSDNTAHFNKGKTESTLNLCRIIF